MRSRKWSSEAERLAAYRSKRTESQPVQPETVRIAPKRTEFVAFRDCPDVPHDVTKAPWLGHGRMVPVMYKGAEYVLIARHRAGDDTPDGVVTAADWHARLGQRCGHGRVGWACHGC